MAVCVAAPGKCAASSPLRGKESEYREAILENATDDAPKCRIADTLRAEVALCDSIIASLEGGCVSVPFVLWR